MNANTITQLHDLFERMLSTPTMERTRSMNRLQLVYSRAIPWAFNPTPEEIVAVWGDNVPSMYQHIVNPACPNQNITLMQAARWFAENLDLPVDEVLIRMMRPCNNPISGGAVPAGAKANERKSYNGKR